MFDVSSVRFPVLSSDPCILLGLLSLARRHALFHQAAGLWGGRVLVQHPLRPPNITVC